MNNTNDIMHNDDDDQILAHFKPEEIEMFGELMGGIQPYPELESVPVYDLTPLEQIFDIPEIQELITAELLKQRPHMAEGGHFNEEIDALSQMRDMGQNGDTELAVITKNTERVLDNILGTDTNVNPHTGFKEYFKLSKIFKPIIKIAAPIAGAFFGGPAGAAGASVLAAKLMGDKWGSALGQGALAGALTYAAPKIGSMFSGFGQSSGSAGAMGDGTLSSADQAQGVLNKSIAGGERGWLDSIMGSQYLAPALLAGSGALMYKGHRDEKKEKEREEQKQLDQYNKSYAQQREAHGFDEPLPRANLVRMTPNTDPFDERDMIHGRERQHFMYRMAKGGPIVGPGTGTSDSIPKSIPVGSYIMDHKDVKKLGNGSTERGFSALDEIMREIPSNEKAYKKGGVIQAMVSNGEYEVPLNKVNGFGKGDNKKGANNWDKFRKQLKSGDKNKALKMISKSPGFLRKMERI